MFQITDGRGSFYQWDKNRKIVVNDSTITQVHFCNKTDDCSLVVEVHNSIANVPNILLQNDFPIRVYAYCGDGYTKVEKAFKVLGRSKPSDYIYEETEVKTVEEVEKRMDELEDNLPTLVGDAVTEYFEENTIDIPTKVSELENDAQYTTKDVVEQNILISQNEIVKHMRDNYATTKYVDDAIENIEIPEVEADLSNYYTKEEIDNKIANINECDTYFLDPRTLVYDTGFKNLYALLPQHMIEFAERLLNGDSVSLYIYDEPLNRWLPAEYVISGGGSIVVARSVSLADASASNKTYKNYTIENVNEEPPYDYGWVIDKGEERNINFASKDYVDNAIANIEIPDEYITETELNAKGYAQAYLLDAYAYRTEIPKNVSELTNDKGYVSKDYVDNAIPDVSNYQTEDQVKDLITAELNKIGVAEGGSY